jgi:hypothetical protein
MVSGHVAYQPLDLGRDRRDRRGNLAQARIGVSENLQTVPWV